MTTTTRARAWSIERRDGYRLGLTDHDALISFDGIDFRPGSGLSAGALVQSSGLSIDNTEAEGALSDDAITETDLRAGRWDGAEVRLWEFDWTDLTDRKLLFRGFLGEVSHGNGAFKAELRGLTDRLNNSGGRVYHPRCSASLGDSACGISVGQAPFSAGGSLVGITDGSLMRVSCGGAYASRWFEHGVLRITSGPAKGLCGKIKIDRVVDEGVHEIELWSSISIDPERGDQVALSAGCNKTAEVCRVKFQNFLNFRGFPHLPGEDWLVAPQTAQRRRDLGGLEVFMHKKSDGSRDQ